MGAAMAAGSLQQVHATHAQVRSWHRLADFLAAIFRLESKCHLTLGAFNRGTANALGLIVPRELLVLARQIIE